jgi:hypothetical protein
MVKAAPWQEVCQRTRVAGQGVQTLPKTRKKRGLSTEEDLRQLDRSPLHI